MRGMGTRLIRLNLLVFAPPIKMSKSAPAWRMFNFKNIANKLNTNNVQFVFKETVTSDVLSVLQKIKIKRSSGPDNIPAKLINDAAEELAAPISILINLSFRTGIFPMLEKEAKITPLYKSGNHMLVDNYRPISVLNILSKVIERLTYQQLSHYLEENNLLCPFQYGFRKGRSTEQSITTLVDFIRSNMDESKITGAVYIDLRKAFDTVDHACLLAKLPLYGIQGIELSWLSDYLFNRTQYVVINNVCSNTQHITHGVPQGSILGPLLFCLLINDLYLNLKSSRILLYADDAVVYFADKDVSIIQNTLNLEIDNIAKWFSDNCLVINLKSGKTEFVLYGTPQKIRNSSCEIKINGVKVNRVKLYEYLGVVLDSNLNLNVQINKIYKKASNRLALLSRIRHNISPFVAESICNAIIMPILLYCYPIYCNVSETSNKKLQKIHDRAKWIIKAEKTWDSIATIRKRRVAIDLSRNYVTTY